MAAVDLGSPSLYGGTRTLGLREGVEEERSDPWEEECSDPWGPFVTRRPLCEP